MAILEKLDSNKTFEGQLIKYKFKVSISAEKDIDIIVFEIIEYSVYCSRRARCTIQPLFAI
jgi:hypothetical protein